MDVEDLLEPEVAVGAAVAAAIFSPKVRGLLRKGAVYGLAGALITGEAVGTAAKNVGEGIRQAGAAAREKQRAAAKASAADGAGETAGAEHAEGER